MLGSVCPSAKQAKMTSHTYCVTEIQGPTKTFRMAEPLRLECVHQDDKILLTWDEVGFTALVPQPNLPDILGAYIQALWDGVVETEVEQLNLTGINLRLYLLNHMILVDKAPELVLFERVLALRNGPSIDPALYEKAILELTDCLLGGFDDTGGRTEDTRGEASP